MDTQTKLTLLADSAKYDVSCSSSGVERRGNGQTLGSSVAGGICHVWSSDGRCISLLKVLMTNACAYDCAYCANRKSNDTKRATFTPKELADLTMAFYRRNYIEGLFLSSAILNTADDTMQLMILSLKILRKQYEFNGYIHAKAIPGASQQLTEELGLLCDRVSINIEMPTRESLALLAPQKSVPAVLSPMRYLAGRIAQYRAEKPRFPSMPVFTPAGQTTQMIIGATPENDRTILNLSQGLYKSYKMKRVYYSAYIPLNSDVRLPALPAPPLLREHRLYQSDFLMRFYHFSADEILPVEHPNLDWQLDPKAAWALRHLNFFPLDLNRASLEEILRVPGIGTTGAQRIIAARRLGPLRFEDLKAFGIVLRRARYFVELGGKNEIGLTLTPEVLRPLLAKQERRFPLLGGEQLSLFEDRQRQLMLPPALSGEQYGNSLLL